MVKEYEIGLRIVQIVEKRKIEPSTRENKNG